MIYLKNYYPDSATIYYQLGNFYFSENMLKKGVSMFEYIISKFEDPPSKEEIYYKLAKYYHQTVGLNGYHLSHKYYEKIVKIGMISEYYREAKSMTSYLEKNFINIR